MYPTSSRSHRSWPRRHERLGPGGGGGSEQGDLQGRAIKTMDLLVRPGPISTPDHQQPYAYRQTLAYVQGRDHEGQTALFAAAEAGWDKVDEVYDRSWR